MNRRTGALMLIVIAVLGAIAYYFSANPDVVANPTPTPGASTSSESLWTLDTTQVTGLTVADSDQGLTFSAAVDETGAWKIQQPQAGEADATQITTLLNTLSGLTINRRVDAIADLGEFGLAAPKFAIEVKLADGSALRATVGEKAVTGFTYYVLRQGDTSPVLVSSSSLDTILNLPSNPPLVTPTAPVTVEPLPTMPLPGTAIP